MHYMESKNVYGIIYGLHDPRTGELRYVGKTTQPLQKRIQGHLYEAKSTHRHVSHWLMKLAAENLSPTISVIANAFSEEELNQLEIRHIALARNAGLNLTNLTDGGEGASGFIRTPETCAKLSAANKGRRPSSETRAKISLSNKGNPLLQGPRPSLQASNHHQWRPDISSDHILKRLAEGATKQQIAKELGVSHTFVHRRLGVLRREQGDHVGRNPQYVDRQERPDVTTDVIVEHLKSGATKTEIARRLGVSIGLIHRRLSENADAQQYIGHVSGTQHYKFRSDVSTDQILALLETGHTKAEAARKLGVSPQFIHQRLKVITKPGL
jgi:uncharacterized protein (DUF433 family)